MNDESENAIEMSKILSWTEDVTLDLALQRSFLASDPPSLVIRRILLNGILEEKLPYRSTRISGICKRIALTKSRLLTNKSIDLANFMIRQLDNDLANIAAHRFFAASTFPLYLKLRGIGFLDFQQQVMLLRSAGLEKTADGKTLHDRVKAINDAKEALINNERIDLSKYDEYARASTAHLGIPYAMMPELREDESLLVKTCLAYNSLTPSWLLDEMWKESNTIAIIVADHLNVSSDTLRRIVETTPGSHASYLALGHSSWTPKEIEELFKKHSVGTVENLNWGVLRGIASNHSIPSNLVYDFVELGDSLLTDYAVVYELLANPWIEDIQKDFVIGTVQDSFSVE